MNLWPHQARELPRLLAGHRLLAWEPGTGKTLAALSAFAQLPKPRRMLVIVPANIRTQWVEVARDYGFTVQEVGAGRGEFKVVSEVVVVSYEMVIRPNVWKSLMAYEYDVLALDEAHACKTPGAKRTRAIFGARKNTPASLTKRASRVWLMTGTPMTVDPGDLWVFVSRLFPDVLEVEQIKNRQDWVARWCTGYDTPYGFKVTGVRHAERLNELLTPFMSRAKKRDVLSHLKEPLYDRFRLPPRKIEITDEVSEELRKFLTALENLGDDNNKAAELVDGMDPQIATLRRAIGLSKAKEVGEHIAEELAQTGEKAIVFYLHTDVGNAIAQALADAGFDPVLYNGQISAGAKVANKARFIKDPSCRVFVGQIQASGTGLDGLQAAASRVFIAEEPWTPGQLDQIVGRADRGGQRGQVYVTSFVVAGSYDDKVSKALEQRARIIRAVIDGERKAA